MYIDLIVNSLFWQQLWGLDVGYSRYSDFKKWVSEVFDLEK